MNCSTLSLPNDPNDAIPRDICAGGMLAAAAALRETGADRETRHSVRVRQANPVPANATLAALTNCFSHDPRTPLRAMEGLGELLAEQICRADPECAEAIDNIRAAGQRLTGVFADLVEFSRLANHKLVASRIDLSALASNVAKSMALRTLGRAVKWTIAPGLRTTGDPELVKLLLTHLFSNALKFTRRVPCACIEFGSADTADGDSEFFVRDNGIGFDPDCAQRMFDVFQRLPGSEAFEGNGIGLAIARRIVVRHGGSLRAAGVPDGGATFVFSIPGLRIAGKDAQAGPAKGVLPRLSQQAVNSAGDRVVHARAPRCMLARTVRQGREVVRFSLAGLGIFAAGLLLIIVSAGVL